MVGFVHTPASQNESGRDPVKRIARYVGNSKKEMINSAN